MSTMRKVRKFLCIADIHGKKKPPQYRKDDYRETLRGKLRYTVDFANTNDLLILIAGDIFHSVKEGVGVLNLIAEELQRAEYPPIAVAGQHDLEFHSDNLLETPIYNLALSGIIRLAGTTPIEGVYGCGYGQEIPEHTDPDSILLIHRCITPEEPPFYLPDAISANKALSLFRRYSIVVSGDYHQAFHKKSSKYGNQIINCGPILRSNKDQYDVKPVFWTIDTNSGKVKSWEIPIKPPIEVFDTEAIEFDSTHGIKIDLTKIREFIGEENAHIYKFSDIVWCNYNALKQNPDDSEIFITEELIRKALNGEPLWR